MREDIMDSRDSFADRRKAHEEEFFHRKEKELIEKARQRAEQEALRESISGVVGTSDHEILEDLRELGYTSDTVALLHLVPLVEVAWAEGKVTEHERDLILEAARLRGVADDSSAYTQLTSWLETRPSEEFFDRTLRVIAALVGHMPDDERQARKRDILDYSTKVAETSGGLLSAIGLGRKVSDEERIVLERIAKAFE
jgi:hypothetical protein